MIKRAVAVAAAASAVAGLAAIPSESATIPSACGGVVTPLNPIGECTYLYNGNGPPTGTAIGTNARPMISIHNARGYELSHRSISHTTVSGNLVWSYQASYSPFEPPAPGDILICRARLVNVLQTVPGGQGAITFTCR
ncbi:MAG: hypothetical protein HYU28_11650 [Actinobacteria bacterium]|nr:hypothetical protein [Actinomycetota bacterium]